jgi:hypothetical protein
MENILENNRLIAEFMGQKSELYEFPQFGYMNTKGDFITEFNDSQLKFHKDWNWLMPVIEKIEALDEKSFETTSHFNGFINKRLYNTAFIDTKNYEVISSGNLMESRIESVYTAILAFIKLYNNKN